MKKILLTLLLVIASSVLLGYLYGLFRVHQTSWDIRIEDPAYFDEKVNQEIEKIRAAVSGETKAPRVKVDEIEYDFGVMELNEKTRYGTHDFIIRNVGTDILKMEEKDKSCFCTNFSIAKKTLAPGEETTCTVTWDGHMTGGNFKQSVIISTNDPVNPEFFFNVKGLYTAPVVCSPNHLTFNGITGTSNDEQEFHILGFGKNEAGEPFPFEFSEITLSDEDHFHIEYEPGNLSDMTDSEKEGEVFSQATSLFNAKVSISPGLPQGSFQELVRFKTNHPDLPYMDLMIEGQVAGSATISGRKYDKHGSGQLVLGSISGRAGETTQIRLDIANPELIAGEETVRVVRVHPEYLQVNISYPDADQQKAMPVKMLPVEITIPAGTSPGSFVGPDLSAMGEIVFAIDTPGSDASEEILLPVNFSVAP